jgi:hypothetical protein
MSKPGPRQEGSDPAGVIQDIDPDTETIFVSRTKDEIKNGPEFDEKQYHDQDYRNELAIAAAARPRRTRASKYPTTISPKHRPGGLTDVFRAAAVIDTFARRLALLVRGREVQADLMEQRTLPLNQERTFLSSERLPPE